MHLIVPPLKWNPATDDMDSGEVARFFVSWSEEQERALVPRDIIFPRERQVWEAVHDCQVNFNAWFKGPLEPIWLPGKVPPDFCPPFPFGAAELPAGERVRIEPTNGPKPVLIWFRPLRYAELEERIVPQAVLKLPRYSQYTLNLRFARTACCQQQEATYFAEAFRLIEQVG